MYDDSWIKTAEKPPTLGQDIWVCDENNYMENIRVDDYFDSGWKYWQPVIKPDPPRPEPHWCADNDKRIVVAENSNNKFVEIKCLGDGYVQSVLVGQCCLCGKQAPGN